MAGVEKNLCLLEFYSALIGCRPCPGTELRCDWSRSPRPGAAARRCRSRHLSWDLQPQKLESESEVQETTEEPSRSDGEPQVTK